MSTDSSNSPSVPEDLKRLIHISEEKGKLDLQREISEAGFATFLVPTDQLSAFIISIMNEFTVRTEPRFGILPYVLEKRK